MTDLLEIGKLECRVYRGTSSTVCYLVTPMPVKGLFEGLAKTYGATWVVISGMDWDNDLTPWPAPNVPATEPPFRGEAVDFLQQLETEVIPAVELKSAYSRRILVGISLSGLFATWAWMNSSLFTDIGSISGSFWYPGFVDWLRDNAVSKQGRACFELGNKEGGARGPREFANIHQQTEEVIEILKSKGIECKYQAVPGNHYADPIPRLRLLAEMLL